MVSHNFENELSFLVFMINTYSENECVQFLYIGLLKKIKYLSLGLYNILVYAIGHAYECQEDIQSLSTSSAAPFL